MQWKLTAVTCVVLFSLGRGTEVVPLPRFHVEELSTEDFDRRFLSQEPVILSGASTCPAGVSFDDQKTYCQGKIGGSVMVKIDSNGNESRWAGLKTAGVSSDLDIADFIASMGNSSDPSFNSSNPRYAFDIRLLTFCPALNNKVHIPAHLVNIFQSQFRYRHMWNAEQRTCPLMPFYNSYLAEAGFESDMHIDAGHTSFTASMCEGHKRWRVMTAKNMSAFKNLFSKTNRTFNATEQSTRGVFPLMSFRSPFDTWSRNSHMLNQTGLIVFEGILSPGETIYIPGGAPHAAITLTKSWMVASNDQTMQEAEDIQEVCRWHSEDAYYRRMCSRGERISTSLENYRLYQHQLPRTAMQLLEAYNCRT